MYCAASGEIEVFQASEVRFGYRHASFAPDDILLGALLELPQCSFRDIVDRIHVCNFNRRSSQPLTQKNAGCIFRNPPGASAGRLIDGLGLKGFRIGSAMVSDRHANFFVNIGRATCNDMLRLINEVRERVAQVYGVVLQEEVVLWVN
jgi:UDP-N-acetylmuramate dehydrogenase